MHRLAQSKKKVTGCGEACAHKVLPHVIPESMARPAWCEQSGEVQRGQAFQVIRRRLGRAAGALLGLKGCRDEIQATVPVGNSPLRRLQPLVREWNRDDVLG